MRSGTHSVSAGLHLRCQHCPWRLQEVCGERLQHQQHEGTVPQHPPGLRPAHRHPEVPEGRRCCRHGQRSLPGVAGCDWYALDPDHCYYKEGNP